jgi:hypothetical protein
MVAALSHQLQLLLSLLDACTTLYTSAQGEHTLTRLPAPAAVEYGQIKLVAAMINSQQHWFSTGAAPPAPEEDEAAVGENWPGNADGSAHGGGTAPSSKRQRLSGSNSGGGGPAHCRQTGQLQQQHAQQQVPKLERGAVLGWIQASGGCTGPQLLQHFCSSTGSGPSPGSRQQLATLLGCMCGDFDIGRRGGAAATSSLIDLEDGAVQFVAL